MNQVMLWWDWSRSTVNQFDGGEKIVLLQIKLIKSTHHMYNICLKVAKDWASHDNTYYLLLELPLTMLSHTSLLCYKYQQQIFYPYP